MMKSTLGRKGFIWLTYCASQFTDGSQGWNLRQELKQKPWRNTADWLAPRVLLNFSYTTKVHLLRGVRPIVEYIFLNQLLIKKMPHRLVFVSIKWQHFSIFSVAVPSSQATMACVIDQKRKKKKRTKKKKENLTRMGRLSQTPSMSSENILSLQAPQRRGRPWRRPLVNVLMTSSTLGH